MSHTQRCRPRLITASQFALLASAGKRRRCNVDQARNLAAMGALGAGYQLGEQVVYDQTNAHWLLDRPHLQLKDLAQELSAPYALVARQGPRQPAIEGDRTREWFGVDLTAPDDEQRIASSRWWPLSARRQAELKEAWSRHGSVPLLVCLGGMIVRGYDTVGLDDTVVPPRPGVHAFALRDGEPSWAERLQWTWLTSGPGRPLILWRRGGGGGPGV